MVIKGSKASPELAVSAPAPEGLPEPTVLRGERDPRPVLIVDDDRGLLRLIEKSLQREGFATAAAASGQAAVGWLAEHEACLMLLDLKLQDLDGKDLIQHLGGAHRRPPFIIITGQGDERAAVDMMKRGAIDYLVKDVDFLQFVPAVVKRALVQLDNERRLAEAEEQVHLIRSVVDQGFSAVLIADADLPDPSIVYVNPAFAQTTGYAAEKIVGQRLSTLAGLRPAQEQLRAGLAQGQQFLELLAPFQTAQGELWGEFRLGPLRDKGGRPTHWLVILRDITERKRLEREILEISDRERQRIGQDLHDGLCQHLAGIELMSQVLEQKLAPRSKVDAARVGEIARHVREAISQTRQLARGLSPVTLESEGLVSALEELAANTERMFGIDCRLENSRAGPALPSADAIHCYRIAQEAVSNAIKHGRAKRVVIRLGQRSQRLNLSIEDDGAGFPEVLPRHPGMGLRIMRYRAGMLGGSLRLEANPGGGARVVCSAPVQSHSGSYGHQKDSEKNPHRG